MDWYEAVYEQLTEEEIAEYQALDDELLLMQMEQENEFMAD